MRAEITAAWQTEDHPRERLTVADEREHVLFYLGEVLYRVVPDFYEEVAARRWRNCTAWMRRRCELPRIISFGTWVGGDMDGNPDVNGKTIRETLDRQNRVILNAYFEECQTLAQELSQSASRVSVSSAPRQAHRSLQHPGARLALHHAGAPRPHALSRVPGAAAARACATPWRVVPTATSTRANSRPTSA